MVGAGCVRACEAISTGAVCVIIIAASCTVCASMGVVERTAIWVQFCCECLVCVKFEIERAIPIGGRSLGGCDGNNNISESDTGCVGARLAVLGRAVSICSRIDAATGGTVRNRMRVC